jgi:predicted small lipoprotein YifL
MVRLILESAVPQSSRSYFRFATFGALIAALCLAGCGRKGPLDLPPTASTQQAPAEGQSGSAMAPAQRGSPQIEYGTDGKPLAPRGQKKKLPGDILID